MPEWVYVHFICSGQDTQILSYQVQTSTWILHEQPWLNHQDSWHHYCRCTPGSTGDNSWFPSKFAPLWPQQNSDQAVSFLVFVISWKIRTRRIQVPEQQKHKLLRRAQIRRVVDVLNEVLVCLLWHVFGARTHKFTNRIQPTVDGRNPANQLIGSLSHCSHSHIPGGDRQISEASTVSTPKSLPCRCIFHQ